MLPMLLENRFVSDIRLIGIASIVKFPFSHDDIHNISCLRGKLEHAYTELITVKL